MNLPAYIERLIWKGQAEFKTRTFFGGLNWAFEVPNNKTIIVLEVNYVPLLAFLNNNDNATWINFAQLYKFQQLSIITDKNSHYIVDPNISIDTANFSGTPGAALNNAQSPGNVNFRTAPSRNTISFRDYNRKYNLYSIASDYVLVQQAFSNSNTLVTTSGIQFLDPITQQKFVDAYNLQIGFDNSGDLPFSSYNGDFGYTGPQNNMYISSPNLLSMADPLGQFLYNSSTPYNNTDSVWRNVNRVMLSYVEVSGNLETLLL